MNPKEFAYLLYYSVRAFFRDIAVVLSELKRPRTWSWVLMSTVFVSIYYREYNWLKVIIPLLFIVKIIRDKQEGRYRRELFEKDLRAGKDTDLVKEYYESYTRDCRYSGKLPKEYKEWKENQLKPY